MHLTSWTAEIYHFNTKQTSSTNLNSSTFLLFQDLLNDQWAWSFKPPQTFQPSDTLFSVNLLSWSIQDKWHLMKLLFQFSVEHDTLAIRLWESKSDISELNESISYPLETLLFELLLGPTHKSLPEWSTRDPQNMSNRVWLHSGRIFLIPFAPTPSDIDLFPFKLSVTDALSILNLELQSSFKTKYLYCDTLFASTLSTKPSTNVGILYLSLPRVIGEYLQTHPTALGALIFSSIQNPFLETGNTSVLLKKYITSNPNSILKPLFQLLSCESGEPNLLLPNFQTLKFPIQFSLAGFNHLITSLSISVKKQKPHLTPLEENTIERAIIIGIQRIMLSRHPVFSHIRSSFTPHYIDSFLIQTNKSNTTKGSQNENENTPSLFEFLFPQSPQQETNKKPRNTSDLLDILSSSLSENLDSIPFEYQGSESELHSIFPLYSSFDPDFEEDLNLESTNNAFTNIFSPNIIPNLRQLQKNRFS